MTDWNEVVRQYGPSVWRTAWRLLGNHADVADCFQKAFLDAFRLARREKVQDWSGLLRRLATARALDCLRDRYRQRRWNEPLADPDCLVSPGSGPEQQAEVAELAERLRAALAELPPRQAEAMCLHWLDHLSNGEIGERLGLDLNAVGALLHRARQRLRQLLVSDETKREPTQ